MENEETNQLKEKKKISTETYIVGTNLVILVIYTVFARSTYPNEETAILLAFLIATQFGLTFLAGVVLMFFKKFAAYGRGFLLSAIIVLLVGFSTCYILVSAH